MNRQIRRLAVALLVCFAALFVQLNRVQLFQQRELQANPNNTRDVIRDFNSERGSIFTIDGTVIATSVLLDDGLGAASVQVDDGLQRERVYPEGDLYGHTTGFFSFLFGADGLERVYNDQLAGQTEAQQFNSLGDLFANHDTTANLTVTLVHSVQTAARDALGDRRGSVVAIDPRTGDLLAFWSNPSYDPTPLGSVDLTAAQAAWDEYEAMPGPLDPRLARMYRETYFPGSTFKVITASAAIESDAASLTEPVFEPATEYVAPLTSLALKNFGGSRCGGTMLDALVASCNTVFAKLAAELVGAGPMIETAERFGFNDTPPIDVPGAAASVFPTDYGAVLGETDSVHPVPLRENTPLLAQAGIGQYDVKATPLEMALVAAGIANGGVIMKPHLMHELRDQSGDLVDRYEPSVWRVALASRDAGVIASAMHEVAARGTARGLAIPGISVGGKTGTAQVDAERPNDTHAWIIGFAGPPGEPATVAVAVLIESVPGAGQQTGGTSAAPIARAVLEAVLREQGHLT